MAKRKFLDFRAVIDLWATRALLAHRLTLKPNTVARWHFVNSIPSHYWRAICAISRGRVRLDDLFDIVEAKARVKPVINTSPRKQPQQDFATP